MAWICAYCILTAVFSLSSIPCFETVQTESWFCFLQKYMLCLAFQIEITVRSDLVLVRFDRWLLLGIDVCPMRNRAVGLSHFTLLPALLLTALQSGLIYMILREPPPSGFRHFCGGNHRGIACDCPRGLHLLSTQLSVSRVIGARPSPNTEKVTSKFERSPPMCVPFSSSRK